MKKIILLTFFIMLINANFVLCAHVYSEKTYQNQWCKANNGVTEYVLPDATRIDCLTNDYAIEFDFANKWAESIGQSLFYALSTGKKAGIVLIMERPQRDKKYYERVNNVAIKYNIKIWTMTSKDLSALAK